MRSRLQHGVLPCCVEGWLLMGSKCVNAQCDQRNSGNNNSVVSDELAMVQTSSKPHHHLRLLGKGYTQPPRPPGSRRAVCSRWVGLRHTQQCVVTNVACTHDVDKCRFNPSLLPPHPPSPSESTDICSLEKPPHVHDTIPETYSCLASTQLRNYGLPVPLCWCFMLSCALNSCRCVISCCSLTCASSSLAATSSYTGRWQHDSPQHPVLTQPVFLSQCWQPGNCNRLGRRVGACQHVYEPVSRQEADSCLRRRSHAGFTPAHLHEEVRLCTDGCLNSRLLVGVG